MKKQRKKDKKKKEKTLIIDLGFIMLITALVISFHSLIIAIFQPRYFELIGISGTLFQATFLGIVLGIFLKNKFLLKGNKGW